jgi:hypothetical protein
MTTSTAIPVESAVGQLVAVLREAFEGPSDPGWSYFADHDGGVFATLAPLSAADASRLVGGASIAAHAHHVSFGLEASAAWLAGDRTSRDWALSWTVTSVTEASWRELRDQLGARYAALRSAVERHAAVSAEAIGGVAGAVAHVAYHLGEMRQKVAVLRSP